MIATGRWAQLERLRGGLDPVHLFQTVSGIGPDLATRIHNELHIDTLEALENAAFESALERVNGIGGRRLTALRAALAGHAGPTTPVAAVDRRWTGGIGVAGGGPSLPVPGFHGRAAEDRPPTL